MALVWDTDVARQQMVARREVKDSKRQAVFDIGSNVSADHDFWAPTTTGLGSYVSAMGQRSRAGWRGFGIAAIVTILLAMPLSASAHVNRVVGRYTFFVVLIEEPFFATNRAGFEFWVRDDKRPVQGLDRMLKAQAISDSATVDLLVSPMNDRGFYDVETRPGGQPFDPGRGGRWTLRLIRSVEQLPVDELFVTLFPAYPRLSAAVAPTIRVVAAAAPEPTPSLAIGVLLAILVAVFGLTRRFRGGAGHGRDVSAGL